jgi:SEFIR domain
MSTDHHDADAGVGTGKPPRVFISYSHDSEAHKDLVRQFATFLQAQLGVRVHLDQWVDGPRLDWSLWATQQLAEADFILVIASPDYKRRAEGYEVPNVGRGAQFEAAMIRDNLTRDLPRETRRILPVVLPGRDVDEIPSFLNAHSTTRYEIKKFTLDGAAELIVAFTGIPRFAPPDIGRWVGAQARQQPGSRPLTTVLKPVACGSDIRMTDAEIDGMRRGNSIVYRPSLFASQPRGIVEYNLGRRFRRFESVAGVLDDADEADQTGCFEVFLDGVSQGLVEARIGKPAWIQHDVINVLRLKLVAWRPGMTVHPALAGAAMAVGRSNQLPSLGWGDPTLVE